MAFLGTQVVTATELPHPEQVFEDAVSGPPSDDPAVLEEQIRRRADDPWLLIKKGELEGIKKNYDVAYAHLERAIAITRAGSSPSMAARELMQKIGEEDRKNSAKKKRY